MNRSFLLANARARKMSRQPFWPEVYGLVFPEYASYLELPGQHELQILGVDKIIYTKSGQAVYLEEKFDFKTYPNCFLEYVSNVEASKPGWIRKPSVTEWLSYTFVEFKGCYFFPFKELQSFWEANEWELKTKYGQKALDANDEGTGDGYTTLGCPVPVDVLAESVAGTIRVDLANYL